MAMESQKRPGSRSPPSWPRQSYPPPTSTTTPTSARLPPPPPPSSRQDPLKPDAPLQPIPAPKYLDLAPVKSEKDFLDTRPQSTSVSSTPAPALTSPSSMYPLGPPPPYSSHYPTQSATATTMAPASHTTQPAYVSSPSVRRDSREEQIQEVPRQSLPSISEALKLPPLQSPRQSHPQIPSAHPPSIAQAAALTEAIHSATTSASPTRSHMDSNHPSSLSSYSSQHSPHSSKPPDPAPQRQSMHGTTDSPRSIHYQPYTPQGASPTDVQPPHMSSVAPATPQQYPSSSFPAPPPTTSYSRPSLPPATATTSQPPYAQSALGVSQPPVHPGYRPLYPPSSGFSFPPPQTSGNSYEQQLSLGAQQHSWVVNAELEKVEEQRRAAAASHAKRASYGGPGYGLTVKRHLDDFDLENSLNEIAERTHQVLEFSRMYGLEAHKYVRTPLPVSQLPPTEKVSEMINQSLAITDALHRLKGTIESMNVAAHEEQARQQQQQSALAKSGLYPSYDSDSPGQPGYGMHAGQDRVADKGDMPPGGGFAGADPKRPKRGRNAPPGRCHSCNRAETPEWRRGPDGARTLCNACGLHYAKLTRKMGAKAGQSGGSNLRPKEGEDTTA